MLDRARDHWPAPFGGGKKVIAFFQFVARLLLAFTVGWKQAIDAFAAADTADNTPMGTVDTADLASGTCPVTPAPAQWAASTSSIASICRRRPLRFNAHAYSRSIALQRFVLPNRFASAPRSSMTAMNRCRFCAGLSSVRTRLPPAGGCGAGFRRPRRAAGPPALHLLRQGACV